MPSALKKPVQINDREVRLLRSTLGADERLLAQALHVVLGVGHLGVDIEDPLA